MKKRGKGVRSILQCESDSQGVEDKAWRNAGAFEA